MNTEPVAKFRGLFQPHEPWLFWATWFSAIWQGEFEDWQLAKSVTLIPDDVWEGEDALNKVAEAIREIQARLEKSDALPAEVIKAQAASLFQNALANATAASGLQQLIKMATDAYCREISNALPDAMEPLAMLPPVLDRISLVLTSDAPQSEREAELQDALRLTANTIAALNRRLTLAGAEIAAMKEADDKQSPKRLFADARRADALDSAQAPCPSITPL